MSGRRIIAVFAQIAFNPAEEFTLTDIFAVSQKPFGTLLFHERYRCLIDGSVPQRAL